LATSRVFAVASLASIDTTNAIVGWAKDRSVVGMFGGLTS
jgi:hypothetical protein